MNEKEFYENLVNRYSKNEATEEELEVLFGLIQNGLLDDTLKAIMDKEIIYEELHQSEDKSNKIKPLFTWYRVIAAASVIFILSFGAYFFFNNTLSESKNIENIVSNNIIPGGNRAILTLDDGTTIILDSAENGMLANQGNVVVRKSENGQIVYNFSKSGVISKEIKYNTITTPRGGQYQIILEDGSKIWLNASSSIRFPTAFTDDERNVEITGEAYFEIAKNKLKPFIVNTDLQKIEVLGTHFNVNSYDDEAFIKTTLLEGSVKVSQSGTSYSKILKPGQQSKISFKSKHDFIIGDANVEEAIAWKEGYFMFEEENIQSIMRKISRWYNVDIQYEGKIPNKQFGGSISKFKNVEDLLEILELTGSVHFKIEGRRITVMS